MRKTGIISYGTLKSFTLVKSFTLKSLLIQISPVLCCGCGAWGEFDLELLNLLVTGAHRLIRGGLRSGHHY